MSTHCSRFPSKYADLPTSDLLEAFAAGPDRLDRVLQGLGPDQLSARPRSGDRWSARQIVGHLADSEIMGAARVRQTLAQSGREFAFYDQDVWAEALGYQEFDRSRFDQARELFRALRQATHPLLTAATDADWNKTGVHPEMGEVTLRQLLELYADHSERHLDQLLEIRALLGVPMTLTPLLPERLY